MSRHLDAALTSGTSPGGRPCTIHLLGAGAVGQALLRRIQKSRHTLVAATDSSGTIAIGRESAAALSADDVADWKQQGRAFADHPSALSEHWSTVVHRLDPDIVIDATSSEPRAGWSDALDEHVLRRGRGLVLVAKNAAAERAAAWLGGQYSNAIGCNAVLGGTGHSFLRSIDSLKAGCSRVAIVGNATTTTIIQSIEAGRTASEGIVEAQRLGYAEPDPEMDLRGIDSALKIAIVAGAVRNRIYEVDRIPCEDIRAVDPFVIRARARRGLTTRLIARLAADGSAAVAYEAVPCGSLLDAPCGRVIYAYDMGGVDRQIYVGAGLGAESTATAAWVDVLAISRRRSERSAFIAAGVR